MSGWLGDAGDSITVSNWATREMSVLRRTLLSGLAATVQTNVRRGRSRSGSSRSTDSSVMASRADDSGAMTGRWHVAGIAGGQLDRLKLAF